MEDLAEYDQNGALIRKYDKNGNEIIQYDEYGEEIRDYELLQRPAGPGH